jgi:hypothetical protein
MEMMKMNAMESLLDPGMFYLDITTGITSSLLNAALHKGIVNVTLADIQPVLVPLVLISRAVVDFLYYYFVSKKEHFGGSMLEFVLGGALWLVLVRLCVGLNLRDMAILFGSTLVMLLAIARLTHWG